MRIIVAEKNPHYAKGSLICTSLLSSLTKNRMLQRAAPDSVEIWFAHSLGCLLVEKFTLSVGDMNSLNNFKFIEGTDFFLQATQIFG